MPRLLHKPPGAETLQPAEDLDTARAAGGWIWLDLSGPSRAELRDLGDTFGFDRLALEDVAEETEYPKADDFGDYVFVVLHGLAPETSRGSTHELDAFIGADYLVTLHRDAVPALDWLWEEAQSIPALSDGGPDRLMARLAEAGARRYLPVVDALESEIARLEDAAIAGDPRVLGEIQALRRDAILLRRVVGPQRDVFRELTREGWPHITDRARRRFDDVFDLHYRIVESLDTARGLLGTVLDTYRSTVAENMNEVMKVLTVFSAILLPLSVLAGIYGMNFANMPELEWRWAYFGLLGLMAAVAVGLWFYFAWRGFIGGPRLHRIPRVVGKGIGGLVSIGTSPLRMVAHLLLPEQNDEE